MSSIDPRMMAWLAGMKPSQQALDAQRRLDALARQAGLAAASVRSDLTAAITAGDAQAATDLANANTLIAAALDAKLGVYGFPTGSAPYSLKAGGWVTSANGTGEYTLSAATGFTTILFAWMSCYAGGTGGFYYQGWGWLGGSVVGSFYAASAISPINVYWAAIGR